MAATWEAACADDIGADGGIAGAGRDRCAARARTRIGFVRRDRPRPRAPPARSDDRARRNPDARSRNARASFLASVPLPRCGGAVDGDDDAHAHRLALNVRAETAHQSLEIRESWWRSWRVVDASPDFRDASPMTRKAHGDAVIHMGGDRAAAGHVAAALRRSGRRPLRSTCARRWRQGPRAMAASRSLSLTRNSSSPRITVRPSANAAATARIGIFVDHRGRALGRHLDAVEPRNGAPRDRRSPRRRCRAGCAISMSAPISSSVSIRPMRRGLSRIAGNANLRARHDQRRDQRKCRRGRIARHFDRAGL